MSQKEFDFFLLTRNIVPCWHEISFDEKTPAIVVKVHKEFLPHIYRDERWVVLKRVDFLKEQFGFESFHEDLSGRVFGFNGVFKEAGESGNFVKLSAEIPVLEKFRMKTCSYCQGHKWDSFFGGECPVCHGSGEERIMKTCFSCNGSGEDYFGDACRRCEGKGEYADSCLDWLSFNAISATFMIFFEMMSWGTDKDKTVSSAFPQLILINSFISKEGGVNIAPVDGEYSIPLVNWFKENPERTIREAEEAMKIAWTKIQGKRDVIDGLNTWAKTGKKGLFYIDCPGDRAGLIPDTNFGPHRGNEGYKFYSHNLDTSAQQITLLTGLAALCDKVRKEIKP